MKTAQTASIILGGLLLSVSGLPAHAQHQDVDNVANDARAARQSGNYAEAATLYKRALEIQEGTAGPESSEVATTLNNLAVLYQDASLDAQAEPLYRRSIAIWEKYP